MYLQNTSFDAVFVHMLLFYAVLLKMTKCYNYNHHICGVLPIEQLGVRKKNNIWEEKL